MKHIHFTCNLFLFRDFPFSLATAITFLILNIFLSAVTSKRFNTIFLMLCLFIGLFPDLPYCSISLFSSTLTLNTFHSTVLQPTALLPSHSAHSTQLYCSPLHCYHPTQHIPLNCTAAHCTATLSLNTFHSNIPQPTALLPSHSAQPFNCNAAQCTAALPLSTFHSTVPQPTLLLPSH